MATEISLSNKILTNLLALKRNADDTGTVQRRLATGLKVGSALDDPIKFFTAQTLDAQALGFSSVKDSIQQGLQTLKTATTALEAITTIVNQMKGIANSALASKSSTERTRLTTEFNALFAQIDQMAADADYNGTNLIQGTTPDDLIVFFNENNTSSITIGGQRSDATGLGFTTSADLTSDSTIQAALTVVDNALTTLRTNATALGSNTATLTARLDFTEDYVNRLKEGSNFLTAADMNEEGANLLALQTRQSLSLNSLSLATRSESAVLQLFN